MPHAPAEPDFSHVEAWIFDLDNTLYPASCDLFAQIDARMGAFLEDYFGCDAETARRIQKEYYREHGTTLCGLMKLHAIDPEPYLSYVHDIDLSVIAPDPRLAKALTRLPGRKIVFTNGSKSHAYRVTERLGVTALFDDVVDIASTGYVPKPDPKAFDALIARCRIRGETSAMFEDIARNLVRPCELGMTTVWLRNDSAWSKQGPELPRVEAKHVHHEATDLAQFLLSVRVKETR